jgi:hypothetical protein
MMRGKGRKRVRKNFEEVEDDEIEVKVPCYVL